MERRGRLQIERNEGGEGGGGEGGGGRRGGGGGGAVFVPLVTLFNWQAATCSTPASRLPQLWPGFADRPSRPPVQPEGPQTLYGATLESVDLESDTAILQVCGAKRLREQRMSYPRTVEGCVPSSHSVAAPL